MDWLHRVLDYTLFEGTNFQFEIIRLLYFVFILSFARFLLYMLLRRILPPIYKRSKVDSGSQYASNQIIKYIIYTVAVLTAIQSLGIDLTVIWGAAAALAVGIGLGVQQTFNDLASGIILLFDGSVEVDDVINVNGTIGKVTKIGIRTTKVMTFDQIMLIIPNSKIVGDQIENWSHNHDKVRFHVCVGVAYGSDTALVKRLMIESVIQHPKVLSDPKPIVRFTDFADSSLNFEIHYWSNALLECPDVQSDIRFIIDQAFRENDISIPFPQHDIWMRK